MRQMKASAREAVTGVDCTARRAAIVASSVQLTTMAARRAVQSTPVTASRALAFICLIAALHGLFFIWYQRPDWTTQWPDQEGYRRLGEVLATTGQFTRF